MNYQAIAAAFRVLADAFEIEGKTAALAGAEAPAPAAPVAAPTPRGRGRPPKAAPEVAPAPAAPAEASDPFAETAPAAPVATLDDVRAALTALRAATNQENALAVLKAAGKAANLTELNASLYGAVVAACTAAMPAQKTVEAEDPFAAPETSAKAEPAKAPTLEDVKAAVVAAQKRTATDTVQGVVMAHGGVAANPDTGGKAPSLKALPPGNFAKCIAALQALPSTK